MGEGARHRSFETRVELNLRVRLRNRCLGWQVRKRELNSEDGMKRLKRHSHNCVEEWELCLWNKDVPCNGKEQADLKWYKNINVRTHLLRMHVLYRGIVSGDMQHTY